MILCTARDTSPGSMLELVLDELVSELNPCNLPAAYTTHLGPRCAKHADLLIDAMMDDNFILHVLLGDFSAPQSKAEARARYFRGID